MERRRKEGRQAESCIKEFSNGPSVMVLRPSELRKAQL